MSRLSFTLRDAKQTAYTVYIFAYDELKSTLTEENGWTNNKKGDKSYSGTYRAALLKKGAAYGTVQAAKQTGSEYDYFASNLELRCEKQRG